MDKIQLSQALSEERTNNYFKQVKGSFIFKFLSILISFLLIPIMIKYLGNEQYGIWSTILSIISWIILFDIGIGNGLRNKITESISKKDNIEAQRYISTAYVMIGFISISMLGVFLLISNYIEWQSVFNSTVLSTEELKDIINIAVCFLFLSFWLNLINQVFNGLQKTSLVVFNQFLSNFIALISVYILSLYFESSLFKLAFVYGFSLVLSSSLLSIWFYSNNKEYIPRITKYSNLNVKSMTSLGIQFFIIQIAVVVIFTTDKILITQLFGPEHVTSYDVVFKLFSIITIVYSLISAPLWSAYNDAYHRNDIIWIKNTIKKQLRIYIIIICSIVMLSFLVKPIISIWIGKDLIIEQSLIIAMALFVMVVTWNSIFAMFINATNNLGVQIKTSIVAIIINIPLSILLVKYFQTGVYGIVLATAISLSLFAVFGALQTFKILKGYS